MSVIELHVYLCPRCSSIVLEPCEDEPVEDERVLLALESSYDQDRGEHGYSRGVYLTPEGVIACLDRHTAEAEAETAEVRKQRADQEARNKASWEGQRNAFFGDAAVPADWQDKTGEELLADMGGEDDG